MKTKMELSIFRKVSIEYLKKVYRNSVSYVLDKNSWKSTAAETYGQSKILLHTRKSLKRFGNELLIFKAPTIEGISIIYYKSMSLVFDSYGADNHSNTSADDMYLLRDLSSSAENENELKIFKLPTVDTLEKLYYKSIGH